jgi:hypothetical protein
MFEIEIKQKGLWTLANINYVIRTSLQKEIESQVMRVVSSNSTLLVWQKLTLPELSDDSLHKSSKTEWDSPVSFISLKSWGPPCIRHLKLDEGHLAPFMVVGGVVAHMNGHPQWSLLPYYYRRLLRSKGRAQANRRIPMINFHAEAHRLWDRSLLRQWTPTNRIGNFLKRKRKVTIWRGTQVALRG